MKTVRVLHSFTAGESDEPYDEGSEIEVSDANAASWSDKGLVKVISDKPPAKAGDAKLTD